MCVYDNELWNIGRRVQTHPVQNHRKQEAVLLINLVYSNCWNHFVGHEQLFIVGHIVYNSTVKHRGVYEFHLV